MPPRFRLSAIAALLACTLPAVGTSGNAGAANEPTSTWEFRDGSWREQSRPATAAAVTAMVDGSVLDRADRLLSAGLHKDARRLLVAWERTNRTSPARDRALLLLADAYDQYGDKVRAFYHLDELMDTYPESPQFSAALQRQYQLADDYLYGHRDRVLGVPLIRAHERGIEMLFRIQQRSPGSPLAEKALLRTGDHYYAWGDYDLAGDAYAAYIRRYPRSPVLSQVRLRAALCDLAQYRGVRFDATPLVDARTQLLALASDHPAFAEREGIPAVVQQIDAALAGKLAVTADFYRRTNEPRAAVYTYRHLIDAHPGSTAAADAAAILARMPESAQTHPAPPVGGGSAVAPTGQHSPR